MSWRRRTSGSTRQVGLRFLLSPSKSKLPTHLKKIIFKKRPPYNYAKPKKFEPMLGHKGSEELLDDSKYWAQYKFDGTRCVVIKSGNDIYMTGRSWKSRYDSMYPDMVEQLRKIKAKNVVLDGELTFFKKGGKDTFLTALSTEETQGLEGVKPKLMLFDVMYVNDADITSLPLSERYDILKKLVKRTKNVQVAGYVKKAKKKYFETIAKTGGEGVMLKDSSSPYEFKRSHNWLKLKSLYTQGADTADCAIIGYRPGRGKFKNMLGSLILAQRKGKKWIYVGHTSGMTDETRLELTARLRKYGVSKLKSKLYNVIGDEIKMTDAVYEPKLVAEVKFGNRTKYGTLRFPKLLRIRDDKLPEHATYES